MPFFYVAAALNAAAIVLWQFVDPRRSLEAVVMKRLRGVCIGAGYFSQFHFDAWRRMEDVEIVAVCDLDLAKAQQVAKQYGFGGGLVPTHQAVLDRADIDFVDIITPPATHLPLVEAAAQSRPGHHLPKAAGAGICHGASRLSKLADSAAMPADGPRELSLSAVASRDSPLLDAGSDRRSPALRSRAARGRATAGERTPT